MLKQILLETGYFVDNSYLDEYLELIQKPFSLRESYTEKHHVVPVVVYKYLFSESNSKAARKLADNDKNNFIVDLLFCDHCKAHWLLYCCTLREVKASNARAYICMTGRKLTEPVELTEEDYISLQKNRDQMKKENSYYWTAEEQQFLYENYAQLPFKELTNQLGRTKGAIMREANILGLKRGRYWTVEEKQWLIQNYLNHSRAYCAAFLQKSEAGIHKQCKQLNLTKPCTRWTADDDSWLLSHCSSLTELEQCCQYLGRSFNAVVTRLSQLKVSLPYIPKSIFKAKRLECTRRHCWSPQEEQWLLANYKSLGLMECAKHFAVSRGAVEHKLQRLLSGGSHVN